MAPTWYADCKGSGMNYRIRYLDHEGLLIRNGTERTFRQVEREAEALARARGSPVTAQIWIMGHGWQAWYTGLAGGPPPCHWCGRRDGYNTEYDGWLRCNSCQGC